MFDFFTDLSESTQVIIAIVIIGVLYFLMQANNKRNKDKRYNRKGRNFRDNYYRRKEEDNQ